MSEKKKLSVAEILAAARKADAGAGSPGGEPAPSVEKPARAQEDAGAVSEAKAAPSKPAKSPAPASSGEAKQAAAGGARPSVADMLRMAREQKAAGAAAASSEAPPAEPPPKAKAEPAAKKPASKTDAAPKVEATSPAEAPKDNSPKDTGSILAAARKADKPGPITKSEAAAKGTVIPSAADPKAKAKVVVPPMPQKPAYAQSKQASDGVERRGVLALLMVAILAPFSSWVAFAFTSLTGTLTLWTLATARFMFPNVLAEPPSSFRVGSPGDYAPGYVENKYKAQFGVWIARSDYNGVSQIYALSTVCTHLGCTPNWLDSEQKFKCPCHGSGFYKDGINFEGPAPRPLERYAIRLADDGQLVVDKSRKFQEELGQWADPACYVPV